MNKTVLVDRWIAALEGKAIDGVKYTQGKFSLCTLDDKGRPQHCCLGVAWELVPRVKRTFEGSSFSYKLPKQEDKEDTQLTKRIATKYGLASVDGSFELNDLYQKDRKLARRIAKRCGYENFDPKSTSPHMASLMEMNDSGVPYKTIAKVIKLRPKGLFGKMT